MNLQSLYDLKMARSDLKPGDVKRIKAQKRTKIFQSVHAPASDLSTKTAAGVRLRKRRRPKKAKVV